LEEKPFPRGDLSFIRHEKGGDPGEKKALTKRMLLDEHSRREIRRPGDEKKK